MVQKVLNHWIYLDHDHPHKHYIQLDLVNNKEEEEDLFKKKPKFINNSKMNIYHDQILNE